LEGSNQTWSLHVLTCGPCHSFHQDKEHKAHLRDLSSNHVTPGVAPYRYHCDTLWKGSVAHASSNLSPSVIPTSETSEIPPETPPKRRKRRQVADPVDVPAAIRVVQMMTDLPPSPISPTTDITPSVLTEQGETLTAYLIRRIDLQEELLEELASDKKSLQEQSDFFNASSEDLKNIVKDIGIKFRASEREVTYLRGLLKKKVDDLLEQLANEKASTALANWLVGQKTNQASVLVGRSTGLVHDLQVEKALVADLRCELAAAQLEQLPVPETLDDIKDSIERLLDRTTTKGTHLTTKVKILCESVLTDVYNGQCLSYLVSRMISPVQRENPY
jgi:hypothetical protein